MWHMHKLGTGGAWQVNAATLNGDAIFMQHTHAHTWFSAATVNGNAVCLQHTHTHTPPCVQALDVCQAQQRIMESEAVQCAGDLAALIEETKAAPRGMRREM